MCQIQSVRIGVSGPPCWSARSRGPSPQPCQPRTQAGGLPWSPTCPQTSGSTSRLNRSYKRESTCGVLHPVPGFVSTPLPHCTGTPLTQGPQVPGARSCFKRTPASLPACAPWHPIQREEARCLRAFSPVQTLVLCQVCHQWTSLECLGTDWTPSSSVRWEDGGSRSQRRTVAFCACHFMVCATCSSEAAFCLKEERATPLDYETTDVTMLAVWGLSAKSSRYPWLQNTALPLRRKGAFGEHWSCAELGTGCGKAVCFTLRCNPERGAATGFATSGAGAPCGLLPLHVMK